MKPATIPTTFTLKIGEVFAENLSLSASCSTVAQLRSAVSSHLRGFAIDDLVLAVRARSGTLVELRNEELPSMGKLFVFTRETWADEQHVGPAVTAFLDGTGSLSDMFHQAGMLGEEPRQTGPSLVQLLQQRQEGVVQPPMNERIKLTYTDAKCIWNASVDLVQHLAFVLDQVDQCKHPDASSARDVVFSISPPITVACPTETVLKSLPDVESCLVELLGCLRDCPTVTAVHIETRTLESFVAVIGSLCVWVDAAIKAVPGNTPVTNFCNLSIRVHRFLALSKFILDQILPQSITSGSEKYFPASLFENLMSSVKSISSSGVLFGSEPNPIIIPTVDKYWRSRAARPAPPACSSE